MPESLRLYLIIEDDFFEGKQVSECLCMRYLFDDHYGGNTYTATEVRALWRAINKELRFRFLYEPLTHKEFEDSLDAYVVALRLPNSLPPFDDDNFPDVDDLDTLEDKELSALEDKELNALFPCTCGGRCTTESESESESEGEGESEPYVREVMHCATVEDEKKPTVQK